MFEKVRNEDLALLKSNKVDKIEILASKRVRFYFFPESQFFLVYGIEKV